MVVVRKAISIPEDMSLRRGSFKIGRELLDDATDELFEFMSNFLILRAEYHYINGYIEYHAVSPLFDLTDMDTIIPEYDFEITKRKDGALDIRTIRLSGDGAKLLRKLRSLDV